MTPELPRVLLDTTYLPPTGRVFSVPAGGDLQAALASAQAGDIVELAAGATYRGNYQLPRLSNWISVRSTGALPPPGTRTTEASQPVLARLDGGSGTVLVGGQFVRLVGLELVSTTGGTIVDLSGADHVTLDRCWVHGTPTGDVAHGVMLNGTNLAVVDSTITDVHHRSGDAQTIMGYAGAGPFKIVNNHLEASGENVMFGGWDPTTAGLVPSDIEIRGNHFIKPLSWRPGDPSYAGIPWRVKNLFELKNAQRVLVDGNLFENNWVGADQDGLAIVLTPRNQQGTAPWSVVQDVTLTHNIVRRSPGGMYLLGWDNLQSSQQLQRVVIAHNVWEDLGFYPDTIGGATGVFVLITDGPRDVTIDHNTVTQTAYPVFVSTQNASRWPGHGFAFTKNIVNAVAGNWTGWMAAWWPDGVMTGNAFVGGVAADYPAGNNVPATRELAAALPDTGADMAAVTAVTAGVITGLPTTPVPLPVPAPAPAPSPLPTPTVTYALQVVDSTGKVVGTIPLG